MVGIDAATGKPINEPEHIRQSIRKILRTPTGSRVMRRDFGFDCLEMDGSIKSGVTKEIAEECAMKSLAEYEPRIENVAVSAVMNGGQLGGLDVSYRELTSGNQGLVEIRF